VSSIILNANKSAVSDLIVY